MFLFFLISTAFANPCAKALEQEGKSILQLLVKDYSDISQKTLAAMQLMYSGKDINDLGHWSSCAALEDSNYLIVDIKLAPMPTYIGLCMPSECTAESFNELITQDNKEIISRYLKDSNLLKSDTKVKGIDVSVYPPKTYPLGIGGSITIFCIILLVGAIILGTYFEFTSKAQVQQESIELSEKSSINSSEVLRPPRRAPKYIPFFICFSIIKNWNSLFFQTISDSTQIFNGVRTFCVGWVIFGHVYATRLLSPIYNIEDLSTMFKSPLAAFGYSSPICLDAFLWVGGFLFGLLILDEVIKRKGNVTWAPKMLGRVLRILPLYIFVMAFVNLVEPSLGEGPLWHQMDVLTLDCEKYWWTNFLFLNNFIPDGKGNDCLGQSWYLAVDMQLFVFSIGVITLYAKYPKKYTWVAIGILCLSSLIERIIVSNENEIMISLLSSKMSADSVRSTYTKPYSRITPYILGLMSGFVYHQYKSKNFIDGIAKVVVGFITSKKIIAYSIFFTGVAFINIVMWVPYPCYQDDQNDFMYYSFAGNVVFNGFYTTLTGIGFTCIFLPILFEKIPIAYSILTWKVWLPIAKASFSIYLTHLCIMRGFISAEQYGFSWTQLNIFADFVFNVTVEFPLGILVYMMVEAPFGRLLKLAFVPSRRVAKEQPLLATELKATSEI